MTKDQIASIALRIEKTFPAPYISKEAIIHFASRFLAAVDAERRKDAVGRFYNSEDRWWQANEPYEYATVPLFLAAPAPIVPEGYVLVPIPKKCSISDAPKCLNTNDAAFWVLGWNSCVATAQKEVPNADL